MLENLSAQEKSHVKSKQNNKGYDSCFQKEDSTLMHLLKSKQEYLNFEAKKLVFNGQN